MNTKLPGTSTRVEIAATLYAQGVRLGMLDALSIVYAKRQACIEAGDLAGMAALNSAIHAIKEHAEVLAEKGLQQANKP